MGNHRNRPRPQRIRRILLRFVLAVFGIVILLFGASIWWTFFPSTDDPDHVDVLLVLGPHGERMPDAEKFMEQGRADAMLISTSWVDESRAPRYCTGERAPSYPVMCFRPEPFTTQGEAISLRDLAQDHGWESAAVMTVNHHVTRTRLLMNRCFDGEVSVIGVEAEGLWNGPLYTYLYQNAGLAQTLFYWDCDGSPPEFIQDTGKWFREHLD